MSKIQNLAVKYNYIGNGATTRFQFNCMFWDTSDISVYINGVLTTNYTITSEDYNSGGAVVFASAPASGAKITIYRNLTPERLTEFVESGAFRADPTNSEFNHIIALIQQLFELVGRTILFSVDSPSGNYTLSAPETGKALIWGQNGNIINSNYPFDTAVETVNNQTQLATNEATAAGNSATAAGNSAAKAQEWATKTDGKIDNIDYSAKYYANQAISGATNAQTSATAAALSLQNTQEAESEAVRFANEVLTNQSLNAVYDNLSLITAVGNHVSALQTNAKYIDSIITLAQLLGEINKYDIWYGGNAYNSDYVRVIYGGAATDTTENVIYGGAADSVPNNTFATGFSLLINNMNEILSAGTNAAAAESSATAAANFAAKAQEWATKTSAKVDNTDYSAKYYANKSKDYADNSAAAASEALDSKQDKLTPGNGIAINNANVISIGSGTIYGGDANN